MTRFYVFVLRAVLGAVFAVFLVRFFYGEAALPYVAGLAIFMVGLAYVLEYWRMKKRNDSNKGEPRG